MNAVESLFTRIGIKEYYEPFAAKGIDKVMRLRNLTEEQLKELLPQDAPRETLLASLNKAKTEEAPQRGAGYAADEGDRRNNRRKEGGSAPASGAAGGEKGAATADGERRPRPKRVCRDFFDQGCGYAGECRYSHDVEQQKAEAAASNNNTNQPVSRDAYREEISVPWDSVKLLLANKADKLNRINYKWGTINSRILRPEAYHQTYTFDLKGTPEGVKGAKADIEMFVGITNAKNRESRFQYANHELERNQAAVEYLAALNVKAKGTPKELSASVVQRIAKTFRFQHEPEVKQFWTLSTNGTDKDKFESLMPLVHQFKGIQAIIFVEQKRAIEMAKRARQTSEALGVKNPEFVHPEMTKEERMKALERFKAGEPNEHGVLQRCLVTTCDYAKFARKVLIPYVNLVLHFSMPKTKELYLFQTTCTGRGKHPGISLLFITHHDATTQKEWSQALDLTELTGRGFEEAVSKVDYDSTDRPLTSAEADPKANWQELWEKEKAERAAAKKLLWEQKHAARQASAGSK